MQKTFTRLVLSILTLATLISCGEEVAKDAKNVDEATALNLIRKRQEVKRYDCKGKLTSDQLETVSSPTYMISLPPKDRDHLDRAVYSNLTNGSSAGCIFNNDSFTVDYGNGWCNMNVVSGGNQIRYRFYYCEKYVNEDQGDGHSVQTCATTPVLREEGTTWIKINYSEETLPGFVEYRPSNCQ